MFFILIVIGSLCLFSFLIMYIFHKRELDNVYKILDIFETKYRKEEK